MISLPLLLIRADASQEMGIGHVMRCLALGQAWQDQGGVVHFCSHNLQDSLKKRLLQENFYLHHLCDSPGSDSDGNNLLQLANHLKADCLALDGYHFTQAFQDIVSEFNGKSVTIDDYGSIERYRTSYVLNPNMGASPKLYTNRDKRTELLIGIDYPLIRREFRGQNFEDKLEKERPNRILVTMGGSDPTNSLVKVIEAVSGIKDTTMQFHIVAGPMNPNFEDLRDCCLPASRIKVSHSVDDFSELYRWADIAISAGGSSNWEMCCYNLPRLIIQTADNQAVVAKHLSEAGIAIDLGQAFTVTATQIRYALQHLVNNRIALRNSRVACKKLRKKLTSNKLAKILAPPVELREASYDQAQLLFDWANDPATRKNSVQTKRIDWNEHQKWLEEKLNNSTTFLYIGYVKSKPIGQIRFDQIRESEFAITFSVDPNSRGNGYGSELIRLGIEQVRRFTKAKFQAIARKRNVASIACFEKHGFSKVDHADPSFYFFHLK